MGVAFVPLFISNIVMGTPGGLYEQIGSAKFWALHAAIAATGAILALVLTRPLTRILEVPTRS
jgi:POT family proton-dependent oligopeptide transporter